MAETADQDGFGAALLKLGTAVARHPSRALPAAVQLTTDLAAAGARATALALGKPVKPVVEPSPKDRRFADGAWGTSPLFFGTSQAYLALSRFLRDVAANGGLDEPTAQKAEFAVNTLIDAAAPTNFLPTNPVALRKLLDTRGASFASGLRNLAEDLASNNGRPRQVDRSQFRLGENLAATPGKVVFRNDLMELIQYAPQTKQVYETPLLLSPPWINKYYIMDLAPGRSFAEWAVQQGHTVFAISYRNPDESMRDIKLDDYLADGLGTAVEVVQAISGAPQVNVVGLCVGGTLAVAHIAHQAAAARPKSVRSVTLLNTLIDFSEPGPLGVFTDPAAVERVEARMAERGFLEEREMASTFDFLRPNDLIWNYVATSWLMGEPPPAFDILAWNADSTRVSEATQSFYLRSCYLENRLASGTMTLAGQRLDLDQVESDVYILAAKEDHITPWTSSYSTTGLLPTDTTFVLSSSGHIAGVVNPPGSKRSYWTNDDLPEDPADWFAAAQLNEGTWWPHWTAWIADRAGQLRHAPTALGNAEYAPKQDAPGTYVRRDES